MWHILYILYYFSICFINITKHIQKLFFCVLGPYIYRSDKPYKSPTIFISLLSKRIYAIIPYKSFSLNDCFHDFLKFFRSRQLSLLPSRKFFRANFWMLLGKFIVLMYILWNGHFFTLYLFIFLFLYLFYFNSWKES